ncbi:nuclear speckle splicing regulatory protein 1-like [Lycorma delicatula]|uniref:nuclear speckle splicing regulatory protein 1-like n=1 Tax=Lycorma delicatula TaxID=130591 RepID=UPI003F516008
MTSSNKQYGLVMPKKKFNITEVKRPSVFNNSDSDEDAKDMGTSDWIKKSFQKQAAQSSGVRRQTEIDMKKAIEQDPTVFKYDEVYDELERKKLDEEKKKNDEKKKPRYIQSLLKQAQQRKLENERRIERQVQKERDAEGEEYKDKETFVTSSYRKKLEEFRKLDEEDQRQDVLEKICDVSKQQDLGGFYRHLYKTTVDKDDSENKSDAKEIINKETKEDSNDKLRINSKTQNEKRQYRKRKTSESSSLEEGEHSTDSDTSVSSASSSSSSSESSSTASFKRNKSKTKEKDKKEQPSRSKLMKIDVNEKEIKNDNGEKSSKGINNKKDNGNTSSNVKDECTTENLSIAEVKEPAREEKPKINIWEKRTVGLVFEAALKRYFERKAERQAMRGN